jgi:hypothetical protein
MDDQETDPESGSRVESDASISNGQQFSVRSLFVITSWASVWLGAWAVVNHYNHQPFSRPQASRELVLACVVVIVTCPFAVFGYVVGHAKLGIIAGLVTSVLIITLSILTTPHIR